MLIRYRDTEPVPTAHGTPKRVLLRGGVLPDVTQAAIAEYAAFSEVEPHVHATMWETFFVLEGAALYVVGGEEHQVEPGDLIVVPPGTVHQMSIGAAPHRAFYWGIATPAEN